MRLIYGAIVGALSGPNIHLGPVAVTPELAVEIYAASVLAIDPDDPAEQAYLAMLASRLKLEPGLRAAVEKEAVKTVA